MVRWVIILVIILGCRTQRQADKINEMKKPVYIYSNVFENRKYIDYTVVDANGNVRFIGNSKLALPDSIKVK